MKIKTWSKYFKTAGISLIITAVLLLVLAFRSLVFLEIKYKISPPNKFANVALSQVENEIANDKKNTVYFEDSKFGVVIPKIDANAKVIADTDPFDPEEYSDALDQGVAHAADTVYPGQKGNSFLFAHSAVDFYKKRQQNVNFYLLYKLESGDDIYAAYNGKIYHYKVTSVEKVERTEVKYLTQKTDKPQLTLMTCWPAGFDKKRVIVTAELV